MENSLSVYLNRSMVGELWLDDHGRMCFQYHDEWLDNPESYHISLSLPLHKGPFLKDSCYAYFANLLPEGKVLTALSRKLGIAESDKFGLLRAIGGDCAGAISLYPAGQSPPQAKEGSYQFFKEDQLLEKISELKDNPFLAAEEKRLSLAGAMEKLPVYMKDGLIYLPENGAPTTHILKTPVEDLQGVVTNEAYCMTLAGKMGLDVPDVRIMKIGSMPVYVIERYDRMIKNGAIFRRVQEDFCQALNLEPQLKYALSFKQFFETIRHECINPLGDARKLLYVIIFNGLIGNSDGHAKNISLLHDINGTRLAPFYDLVSTQCYKEFTRKMPVKIAGKKRDFNYLKKEHFVAFADEIQMKPSIVMKTITDLSQKMVTVSEIVAADFKTEYGSIDVVDRINALIKNHAVSMLEALS